MAIKDLVSRATILKENSSNLLSRVYSTPDIDRGTVTLNSWITRSITLNSFIRKDT